MYFSSKVVVDLTPPVTTHCFQPYGKPLGEDATEEQVKAQRELEEQIVELGVVDDVHYHFVPEGLELCDQPEKAEVTQIDVLLPEVESKLVLNGAYAINSRYIQAAKNILPLTHANEEHNFVNLWQAVSDISDILGELFNASAVAYGEGTKINPALERLKALKKQSDDVKTALSKVGL